jgi:hypothetical protein
VQTAALIAIEHNARLTVDVGYCFAAEAALAWLAPTLAASLEQYGAKIRPTSKIVICIKSLLHGSAQALKVV